MLREPFVTPKAHGMSVVVCFGNMPAAGLPGLAAFVDFQIMLLP